MAWKRGIRLRRRFSAPPLVSEVSLRFGHARGKITLSCFLILSRRFATRSTAQMRTPFCDLESHRGALESSRTGAKETKKTTELLGLGCPFIWRRKRDSNPRAFWANGFQDRLVVTASIFLHITATHMAAGICREYLCGS